MCPLCISKRNLYFVFSNRSALYINRIYCLQYSLLRIIISLILTTYLQLTQLELIKYKIQMKTTWKNVRLHVPTISSCEGLYLSPSSIQALLAKTKAYYTPRRVHLYFCVNSDLYAYTRSVLCHLLRRGHLTTKFLLLLLLHAFKLLGQENTSF